MMRWLRFTAVALLAGCAACYAGDWLVFNLRGTPSAKVTVSHFLSAPLKNNKQELDYLGSQEESCSISLFPQAGEDPCWYLRRHTNQVSMI
jgi:hypothetical protein